MTKIENNVLITIGPTPTGRCVVLYKNLTAQALADTLATVIRGKNPNAVALAHFEPILQRWSAAYPKLQLAYAVFVNARRNYYSFGVLVFSALKNVSERLIAELQALGEAKLRLCPKKTYLNEDCDELLDQNGSCPMVWNHMQ